MNEIIQLLRNHAEQIFMSSVEAVDPFSAVERFLHLNGSTLIVGRSDKEKINYDLTQYERILVVGGGKATARMAKAVEYIFGEKIKGGIINVKYGFTEPLDFIEVLEAGHPIPDENGLHGTKKILRLLEEATEKDLIISLISGGGSALLPQPAGEISLHEKQAITSQLLDCGASIDEINTIRKHISSSKGGQMARAAYPATIINMMLSDVVGDRMDVIASGPFVPDPSTFQDALEIINKYELGQVPQSITNYLEAGAQGKLPETPKPGDKVFDRVINLIIGSNIIALEAAEEKAKNLGYKTLILSSMIEGETKDVASVHVAIAKEILKTGRPLAPPACIISGGETTVTIRGTGLGGRNQEFCLAAAMEIAGMPERVVILSGGTDGNDGPTDAAGAIVDPSTAARGKKQGLSALDRLKNNDAYHFFEKTGDLLITGPTNTNVMDVHLILIK